MSRAITPDAVYDLTAVSEPSLSPDGSLLTFVRTKVYRERMEARSRIMATSVPDGEPYEFTQGGKDGSPRFSPDGETIAFIRPDEKDRKQLWLIPASGGEARQLTDMPGGVSDHAWSPDSLHLAFTCDVDPDRPPDDHDPKKDPRVRTVRRIRYRHDLQGWRGDAFRHLFVVNAETGENRPLTDGDGDDTAPKWSPDGKSIAFVSDRRDDRDYKHYTDLRVVSSDGGEPQKWSDGLYSVGTLAWSPDGTMLAVIGSDDPEMWDPRQWSVFITEPGRAPRQLIDGSFAPVLPAHELRWSDDGRIVFLADSQGESFLCQVSANGGELERLAGGGVEFTAMALDKAAHNAVVVAASPESPGDLLHVDTAQRADRQLTAYNRHYLEEHQPAALEKFSLTRHGVQVESRVLLPPRFDPSGRYPLIVDIHGGPQGKFSDSFDLLQQVMSTAGYVVLAVNPRGSSSYGPQFAKAVLRDWGGEDYLDIMAAVDEVCSRPYVEESRLGVHGYSYGGYMGSWIVGQDTRFGAAVIGAPCTNLWSMYGTSDIGVSFEEIQLGAMPEEFDAYLKRSPLSHALNVETPVLLLHGEDDLRCPIGQSEEYFVALKRLGKEVEFVRFPGCNHGFPRRGHPKMRVEYLRRTLDWFDKHLRAEAPSAKDAKTVPAGG